LTVVHKNNEVHQISPAFQANFWFLNGHRSPEKMGKKCKLVHYGLGQLMEIALALYSVVGAAWLFLIWHAHFH